MCSSRRHGGSPAKERAHPLELFLPPFKFSARRVRIASEETFRRSAALFDDQGHVTATLTKTTSEMPFLSTLFMSFIDGKFF